MSVPSAIDLTQAERDGVAAVNAQSKPITARSESPSDGAGPVTSLETSPISESSVQVLGDRTGLIVAYGAALVVSQHRSVERFMRLAGAADLSARNFEIAVERNVGAMRAKIERSSPTLRDEVRSSAAWQGHQDLVDLFSGMDEEILEKKRKARAEARAAGLEALASSTLPTTALSKSNLQSQERQRSVGIAGATFRDAGSNAEMDAPVMLPGRAPHPAKGSPNFSPMREQASYPARVSSAHTAQGMATPSREVRELALRLGALAMWRGYRGSLKGLLDITSLDATLFRDRAVELLPALAAAGYTKRSFQQSLIAEVNAAENVELSRIAQQIYPQRTNPSLLKKPAVYSPTKSDPGRSK